METKLIAIGYETLSNGKATYKKAVAWQYACTKEGCNCEGSWFEGNPEYADSWRLIPCFIG